MKAVFPLVLLGTLLFLSGCTKENSGPKKKYFNKVEVKTIPAKNLAGTDWDSDGTGPDIYLEFGPTNGTATKLNKEDNVNPSKLPYTITFTDVAVTGEEWTFKVMDADDGGTDQLMGKWVFDPDKQSEEENPIHLTGSSATWDVYFHVEEK